MERRRNLPSVVYVVEQAVLLGGAEIDGLFWTLTKTRPRKSEPRTVRNPTWDARQVPVPKYVQQWPCKHLNQQDEQQDGCKRLGFSLCRGKYEKSRLIIHQSGVYLFLGFFLRKEPCQQDWRECVFIPPSEKEFIKSYKDISTLSG